MSLEKPPAAPVTLAFRAVLVDAFTQVFRRFGSFARAAALPMALSLALSALAAALAIKNPSSTELLFRNTSVHVLGLLPLIVFGIAVGRRILLDRMTGPIAQPALMRRSLTCFAYVSVFMLLLSLPIITGLIAMAGLLVIMAGELMMQAVVIIPIRILMPWHLFLLSTPGTEIVPPTMLFTHIGPFFVPFGKIMTWVWISALLPFYLMTRLSLVFPALSADQKLGLVGSWRLTRKNSLKLFAALTAIAVLTLVARSSVLVALKPIFALLSASIESFPRFGDAYYWLFVSGPVLLIEFLLVYLGVALTAATLALAYARLNGWGGPGGQGLDRVD